MLMENIITNKKAAELMLISARIRRSALEMVYRATSGHLGGSFSICELLTALYFNEMNIDPQKPHCPDRDLTAHRRSIPRWPRGVISRRRS